MCGSRSSGSPSTSTSGTVAATVAGSGRSAPQCRAASALLGLTTARSDAAAATIAGDVRARPAPAALAVVGRARRRPADAGADGQHADAGRPPQLRASPASTDQPPGSRRVAERLGRIDDRAAPADPGRRPRRPAGVVPTSWLAACSAAAATPGCARPRRRTRRRRPGRSASTPTDTAVHRRATCDRRRAGPRSARPRCARTSAPARRLPRSVPRTAACSACVPWRRS